jgi:ABC-type Mn2+/Zn2+ transport system ATPase subunit
VSVWRSSGARVRFGEACVALPDVVVERGARVAVVGPNGSGKTTLLRVLAGLVEADGRVERGVDLRDVAWVAQRPYLVRGSVSDNVALALLPHPLATDERRRRVREAIGRLGITDLADRPRSALSEGQLQRVALARTLVTRPKVLLLDEPLGPLDAAGAARLAEILREERGMTLVVAAPTPAGLPTVAFSGTIELR